MDVAALLVVCAAAICSSLNPFGLHGVVAIGAGVVLAMAILVVEMRLRWAAPRGLLGGALGAVLGIFAAVLVTLVVSRTAEPERTKSFLEYGVLVAFAYLGGCWDRRRPRSSAGMQRDTTSAKPAQRRATLRGTRSENADFEIAGYERADRRANRGYLRGAISGWAAAGAAVCAA